MQQSSLARFWSGTASFGEFAATLVRKGYLTEMGNVSKAGDFSSPGQAGVCYEECVREELRTCSAGAQRAALTEGCGQHHPQSLLPDLTLTLLALLWGAWHSLPS